jgi:lipopolysaccharide/colanic/teichoic acid biosynthesis glycosyltransferase
MIKSELVVGQLLDDGIHRDIGKVIFDKTMALVLLLLCSPIMLLTAGIVATSIGRPLFYRQDRAGIARSTFGVEKFRTMSEERGEDGQLLADELRQTRATAILRRIRLDELPQLLAVLRGDMSFVGPRPLPISVLSEFGEAGLVRCLVAPGMTGWAQVNGNTRLKNEQKLALDIWYIDHRTLALDLFILLLTVTTLIAGERINAARLETAERYLNQRKALMRAPSCVSE